MYVFILLKIAVLHCNSILLFICIPFVFYKRFYDQVS